VCCLDDYEDEIAPGRSNLDRTRNYQLGGMARCWCNPDHHRLRTGARRFLVKSLDASGEQLLERAWEARHCG